MSGNRPRYPLSTAGCEEPRIHHLTTSPAVQRIYYLYTLWDLFAANVQRARESREMETRYYGVQRDTLLPVGSWLSRTARAKQRAPYLLIN